MVTGSKEPAAGQQEDDRGVNAFPAAAERTLTAEACGPRHVRSRKIRSKTNGDESEGTEFAKMCLACVTPSRVCWSFGGSLLAKYWGFVRTSRPILSNV